MKRIALKKTDYENLIKSLRKQDLEFPADYDLCSSYNKEYVNIMLDYRGSWTLRYFGYSKQFNNRKDAIDWLEVEGIVAMKDQMI